MFHLYYLFILALFLLYLLDLAFNDIIFILLHITIKIFSLFLDLRKWKLFIHGSKKIVCDRLLKIISDLTFHSFILIDYWLLLWLYRSKQILSSCIIFSLFMSHTFIMIIKLVIKKIFVVFQEVFALKLHFIIVRCCLLLFDIIESIAKLLWPRWCCLQSSF